jgi:hypothetical protein
MMLKKDLFKPELLREFSQVIKMKLGFNLEFSVKEMNEGYLETDFIVVNGSGDDKNAEIKAEREAFLKQVVEFEVEHTKIINKSIFLKSFENTVIAMSEKQLITSYKHLKNDFISKWLKHPEIARKDDMNIYPNISQCPPNKYNLWTPFTMANETGPYVEKHDQLAKILKHIHILCGNDQIVGEYVINWIGQMIQFPERKSTCLTFISGEGAGKGTLLRLFEKMMGTSKVFETSEPSRDVWGSFNGIMKDAFLVNLNEISKKDTMEAEGKLKKLITDPTITINMKGVNAYDITSYHRFIITTNSEDPIKTSKDDRRKLIIRSSDELLKNTQYFNEMYEDLNDINVIRTCYEYFKELNLNAFEPTQIPITEYQTNLKELSVSPIEHFIQSLVQQNLAKPVLEKPSSALFDEFEVWKSFNGFGDYKLTSVQFGVRLANCRIVGITSRISHGKIFIFNIPQMKQYFRIGVCLVQN